MWRYNKGEWSEIYTFAHLLNTGILHSADSDLNAIDNVYFPIIRIIREETPGNKIDYFTGETIRIYRGNTLLKEVNKEEFKRIAEFLLTEIPQGSRAFEINRAEEFFNSVYCEKVKANPQKKEDITTELHDINTGINAIMGFSIKSYLGANPTLINAGINTNFRYKITGCNNALKEETNGINTGYKIKERIRKLRDNNCELIPIEHSISRQFEDNLQFVDTLMPKLLQYVVLYSYWFDLVNLNEITNKLEELNPLGYSNVLIYKYKIKKLLCAFALGLNPERTDWLGAEDANGGYIIVKSNGEVVCYHLYNRMDFEEYLYNHSYFERASTSKHKYMSIEQIDNDYIIPLNLQVRFKEHNG